MEGATEQFLGRSSTLASLLAAFEADRPVAVLGEAGIGKTTLVRRAIASSGRRSFESGGLATAQDLPYVALRQALGRALDGDASAVAADVEAVIGPDILFVDDAQWLDRAAVDALTQLADRIQVVAAVRLGHDAAVDERPELLRRLDFELLRVGPLDDHDARAVVVRVRPELRRDAVDAIVVEAAGNPLLLEELAVAGTAATLPGLSVATRLARLSAVGRSLVELLAVADRPIERDRLAADISEPLAEGIVVERGEAVEIRHALLARAVEATMTPAALARRHVELAELLDDPAERSRHLLAAGDRLRALAVATEAIGTAQGPRERASLLVIAADASSSEPVGSQLDRRLAAARALDALGDWSGVLAVLREPDDPESEVGLDVVGEAWPELRAEGDALAAHAAYELGRHDEARALLIRARSWSPGPAGPAAARVAWESAAFMVNVDGALGEAIGYLDLRLAAHPADDPARADLTALRESLSLLAGLPTDLAPIDAAIGRALAAGAFARAADLSRVINVALLMGVGSAAALEFLERQVARFDEVGASEPALEFQAEAVEANILAGRFREALLAADELTERPAPRRAVQAAAIFRCLAMGALGRLDEADDGLVAMEAAITDDWFGRGRWLAVRAQIALWSGRPDRARQLVERVVVIPTPLVGGHVLPLLTGAWAAVELDDAFAVAAAPIRSLAGGAPEFEGLGRLAAGDAAAAAGRFVEAAALWEGFIAVRAMTCRWAAADHRRDTDPDGARADLAGVLEQAEASGFEPLAARARRSLRLAGVHVATTPRGVSPEQPPLTRRERELLDLVGRGQTNIEIARRMGLGRPTVARILSNAMSRLGATSRVHAVALAVGAVPRSDDAPDLSSRAADRVALTSDARALLSLLSDGLTLGEASARLGISRRTADRRLADARRALGAERTAEAVARARRAGWLAGPDGHGVV
jgi:DNA-binding CsgD family transcriptional regulator